MVICEIWAGTLRPARLVCLYDFGFGDDYGFNRHVVVVAVAFGGHAFDGVNDILAFYHFAEYGVAPAVQAWGGVVEEVVVFGVDEELGGGAVRVINRTAELLGSSSAQMATAAHPIADAAEFLNPNCVKVVLDQRRNALYFSRAPIAWPRDAFAETQAVLPEGFAPLRHIGLYAYRVGFLHQYVGLPPSPLESIESLEQLRVLWHGGKIAVTVCDNAPAAGVDTAEDLQRVRDWFARHPEEAT